MFEEHIGRLALLHKARGRVSDNKLYRKELTDTFFAEHAEFFTAMEIEEGVKLRAEADVRQEALSLYRTIPNLEKTSIPGVTIKESKVVGYDSSVALEWAMKHQMALQLNEGAYKRLVLEGQAPGSIDVALTVAIATDLSPFAKEIPTP